MKIGKWSVRFSRSGVCIHPIEEAAPLFWINVFMWRWRDSLVVNGYQYRHRLCFNYYGKAFPSLPATA